MEAFLANAWIFWLVAGVVFLLVELGTAAMVSVWFVPSAVIVAVLSLFWHNFAAQVLIFLALSFAFLLVFRRLYKKHKAQPSEERDRLVGKTATVEDAVSEDGGRVLVGDVYWNAVAPEPVPAGERVVIEGVSGTTLTVRRKR